MPQSAKAGALGIELGPLEPKARTKPLDQAANANCVADGAPKEHRKTSEEDSSKRFDEEV